MIGNKRTGVFLSYARKDGEQFAGALRERLRTKAPDIPIKQDRLLLEGGVGWWKQLTEAIDSVEFLVLVMTPSAMQSETVRKEWRYARQQGICVYPVKAAPDSELQISQLPRWMNKAHFFDIEKEWESFLAHLRKGCDTSRVPFMAPDLPDTFVQRPEEFGRLKNLLLIADRKQPVAITTALSGAGGFGKTTLAAALCHDEEIIQNFDDGILWGALGQNPNVLGSLLTLYAALTGERPGFATEEDAAFQLGQKLEDRTCLLVIDDVWDDRHLKPFLRGGKGCARLFTTRNAEIASTAQPVTVDEMRESESLAMLAGGVPGLDRSRALELSRKLGEWPFALELARAMMQLRIGQGDSPEHAADWLLQVLTRKGAKGLARGIGDAHHRNIDGLLEGSLALLEGDKRKRLTELSIFPEDVAIPLSSASALWGLDQFEAEETAQQLARLQLLRLDLRSGTMRLHDLMRSWLAAAITNAIELHSRLVDAWTDWMHLPDTYAWRWLTWHLVRAKRAVDVERILWDPAWLQAKLAHTDVNALLSDFHRMNLDTEGSLIEETIRLSSHILAKDPRQFPSQMVGRLLPHSGRPIIHRFIDSLTHAAAPPWLRPLRPALDPPGTGLLRTLAGHSESVNGVALSVDGRRAVSASDDQTLKVWDLETGAELHTLAGHSWVVEGVALSTDGRWAVSASWDATLKVWDLETGAELRTLVGHSYWVNGVALSADGRRAVSASNDKTLKVWDLETGTELRTLAGHSDVVNGVALSADGRRAVSASDDKTLKLWDLETGTELRTLAGHSPINGVALSADGRRAVSASWDKTLKVWDLETGAEVSTLAGHSGGVNGVALSADGTRAVSASHDNTLKVWSLETGAELRTLAGHSRTVNAVALSADGRWAVSASDDNTLRVWDLEADAELRTPAGNRYAVNAVALSADGRWAVSASDDNTLKVWDMETGAELRTLAGHSYRVNGVALSADGRRAVSASNDKTLKVWDMETGAELLTLAGHSSFVNGVALSADGRLAVSASWDDTLKTWDLETGVELRTLTGHSDAVHGVALSADGRRAVSAASDNTLKVWDLETGAELRTLTGHTDAVWGVALSADGRRAVSASSDKTLKVWDLETGAELRTLTGHTDGIWGVALSADGRRALSASSDNALKVWDLETGGVLATFTCDAAATCCATAGTHAVLAGDDTGHLHWLSLELED